MDNIFSLKLNKDKCLSYVLAGFGKPRDINIPPL